MSDKISPPTKKVARADGLKSGTANRTLTTPSQDSAANGRYFGQGKGSKDSIFK